MRRMKDGDGGGETSLWVEKTSFETVEQLRTNLGPWVLGRKAKFSCQDWEEEGHVRAAERGLVKVHTQCTYKGVR
jgi:hypothetical protein